eukprot:760422-Hanusia_phi.AAC.2
MSHDSLSLFTCSSAAVAKKFKAMSKAKKSCDSFSPLKTRNEYARPVIYVTSLKLTAFERNS